MPDDSSCVYCRHEALEPQFVFETANFVALAPLDQVIDGHLLVIPRTHILTLRALSPDLRTELERLKARVQVFASKQLGAPLLLEQEPAPDPGHARLHVLPGLAYVVPRLTGAQRSDSVHGDPHVEGGLSPDRPALFWETPNGSGSCDDPDPNRPLAERLRWLADAPTGTLQEAAIAARTLRRAWQSHLPELGEPVQVVTCLLRRGERICIFRRSEALDSAPGKWHGVSGYLPEGVPPLDQAYREIEQEVGLIRQQLALSKQGTPLTFGGPLQGRFWRIHSFLFDLLSGEPKLNWEHTDLAWVRPSEVGGYDCVPWLPNLVASLVREG